MTKILLLCVVSTLSLLLLTEEATNERGPDVSGTISNRAGGYHVRPGLCPSFSPANLDVEKDEGNREDRIDDDRLRLGKDEVSDECVGDEDCQFRLKCCMKRGRKVCTEPASMPASFYFGELYLSLVLWVSQ